MEIKELKKFLKNSYGYITTKEIESIGISKALIPELINQKILRKVAYGIYIDNNLIEDEFYILQKRFSNIVFSYNTACYLMNLSDRAPYKIDVTTINHNNINENLNIYYVSKEKFNIGITEIESPYSNPIKIYNAEGKQVDIPIGSEITLNGNTCTIVNGTTQCKFLDNCTDSGTSYNFDFKMDMKNVLEQNQLLAGNYKIKFAYAFAQNNLLNGNIAGWIDVPLTIIDYSDNYGIDVSIDNSENLAEDKLQLITKGKEEVRIIHTNCSGQLENPFVKVSVVEKTSDFDYSATENSKKITVNDNGDGSYKVAFSDSLDVGTYRVIFELFDKYGNKMSENFANFIVVDKPNI